ncbi:PLP-dependent aminotransferase family protein [Umezawaea beigongshangensis]|uniref:aminotransferase-like domain-containing protein n=1 Tax=Umezawaea beigongshangensis TaxID=2780383 RepID=UPI0018F24CB2|nr:PLP-dependent aminotransferase family protein [Umezawaea beigongshangensis]
MEDYRALADELAADIAAGRLTPGQRLIPQRAFARQRRIAASTAARVYRDLVRRGLAVGEVGRGTFVRVPADVALADPGGARVDLELNFPVLPEQPALLARSLTRLLRPDVMAESLRPVGVDGTPAAREAATALLARPGWAPDPRHLLFAGNGRQAIAGTIAAFAGPGDRLGVEELTYPVVRGIAARLGVTLVPLAVDEHGLVPDAVRAAGRLRALYVQPTMHNPLGTTAPHARRAELAEVARELDLPIVEDAIYSFLREDPAPLAAHAPERTVVVESLSKRLSPGLTLGFAATPPAWTQRVASALRSGGWIASHFALDAATCWMGDGTASGIAEAKRRDAAARQRMVRDRLAGFDLRADPGAYHAWWELPEPWRAETFVAAAARRGIAVSPAAAFAVGAGRAPDAVRLALAAPPLDDLAAALDTLAALARRTPEDAGVD